MATKKELQAEYKKIYGESPDEKVTVKELTALISKKKSEKETGAKETAVKSGDKTYVKDPSLLKSVEGIKDTRTYRDESGEIQGGRLYYGELK